MKTKKLFKNDANGYFESLPEAIQTIVRDLILDAAGNKGGPECYKRDEDAIESIECQVRSGFIPFDHNRGGLVYQNFTDLSAYWGGGYSCNHKDAAKDIERQIEYSLKMAADATYDRFKAFFDAAKIPKSKINYCDLVELQENSNSDTYDEIVSYIQDAETECLSGDYSSIMHEIRFMYHGEENGIHRASVSAAVNTEGPYHRSHISWAPGVFCEGSKEVEITWRTEGGLKRKLKKALAEVSKAVF